MVPVLEDVCEGLNGIEELTPEVIEESLIEDGPFGQFGRAIIKYQSKAHALQDLILDLRENDRLSVEETMKVTRELSRKQFRNQFKANRLLEHCRQNGAL